MRVNLQPAFLLHSRPYRDSSQLLDVFTAEHGRLGLVARGVHRKARGGSLRATLQPFRPLLLSFSGRGELMTLVAAEAAPGAVVLQGERLFSGLYLNELLLRLLHRDDPHPMLFAWYGDTLRELAGEAPPDATLRRFELRLLDELGYGFDPGREGVGHGEVREDRWYYYSEGQGMVECADELPPLDARFAGADLAAIAAGRFDGTAGVAAKRLLREVIATHLGGKPLHTRELFRQYRQRDPQ